MKSEYIITKFVNTVNTSIIAGGLISNAKQHAKEVRANLEEDANKQ